jgi:hypothetical protein
LFPFPKLLGHAPTSVAQGENREMPGAGQSHLIFGTGSTGCVTINQPSTPCCANVFYKLLEKLDAIALMPGGHSELLSAVNIHEVQNIIVSLLSFLPKEKERSDTQ